MSPTSISMDSHAMLEDPDSTDRRADQRYPIALQLQYKLIRNGRVERRGFGRTVNISSRGVLFEINCVAPTRGRMELALKWPFLHQGSCRLKLIMRGRILRTDEKTIALRAEFRELRTAGRSAFEGTAVPLAVRAVDISTPPQRQPPCFHCRHRLLLISSGCCPGSLQDATDTFEALLPRNPGRTGRPP